MAIETIGDFSPARERVIFIDRQCFNVAYPPPVEIAGIRMMRSVSPAPVTIGRQREHSDRAPDEIVYPARSEKRSVPAIMLKNEEAHQEPAGGNGQQQRDPVAV